MLEQLVKFLNLIIKFSGKYGSILIICLILLVSTSVILRYVFSVGFIWLQDLYIWVHAIFILLGIAFTLNANGHVRIDLLYRSVTENFKKKVNLLGALIFGLPLSFILVFYGFDYFYRSYQLGESSKESGGLPYIFILKFFIFVLGILLFFELLRQILNFIKKND
jgi:TRAP-type mannitol/chloroaromatic compound transport system permease small subunit|tara:strand:+ start:4185 stop:4679 length:495 start_codon:yes stop_codon:yes gene_type:complete